MKKTNFYHSTFSLLNDILSLVTINIRVVITCNPSSWSHLQAITTEVLRGYPCSSVLLCNKDLFTHLQKSIAVIFVVPFTLALSLTYSVAFYLVFHCTKVSQSFDTCLV